MSATSIMYEKITTDFKDKLLKEVGGGIDAILLYGSVAKKQAGENSDIDILVVTRGDDKGLYDTISKIRTRIDLENDTLTSLLQVSRREFEEYTKLGSPFLKNILENGVILYDRGILKKVRGSLAAEG